MLPNNLRSKEERERQSAQKKPRDFKIELSNPKLEKPQIPLRESKPSVLSRLFATKLAAIPSQDRTKPETLIELGKQEKNSSNFNEPVAHIPRVEAAEPVNNGNKSGEPGRPVDNASDKTEKLPTTEEVKISQKAKPASGGEKRKKWFRFSRGQKNHKKDVRNFSRDEVLDVNLIPSEFAKSPELELPRKVGLTVVAGFLALLLVAVVYLGITWYQLNITRQLDELESEIISLNKQIVQAEMGKADALKLQKRLEMTKDLLDHHIYWTNFFELLERYTIEDVYYLDFAMSGRDKLVISARGKDYEAVAKQLLTFQQAKDFVKNVSIDSASAEIDPKEGKYNGVSFNVHLEFFPEVFLKSIN